jgi:predicted RNase H-like HicB family nuclease
LGFLDVYSNYATGKDTIMNNKRSFTAIIEREGDGYVSICPELDIASQGDSVEDARSNLVEAVELFLETASASEIKRRLHDDVFISRMEVSVGKIA